MRMTIPTRLVLAGLLDAGEAYGLELARVTGLRRSTVYAALDRLESNGLVKSRREQLSGRHPGRPRYYWSLDGQGEAVAAEAAHWLADNMPTGAIGRAAQHG